jgi:hypothetical protein
MKKLGRFDSDPPNVEGSGGVNAEGDTAFEPAFPFLLAFVLGFVEGRVVVALPWTWVTAVRGCGCWVRTSGAGTVVVASLPVLVPVALASVLASPVVLVVVVLVPLEGSEDGGAGTLVVVVVAGGAAGSAEGLVVVLSARAALAGISTASAARSGGSVAVSGRRIIVVQLPSR